MNTPPPYRLPRAYSWMIRIFHPLALAAIIIVAVSGDLKSLAITSLSLLVTGWCIGKLLKREADASLNAYSADLKRREGVDPVTDAPSGVAEALRAGDKIRAVSLYRESTGVGLAEAVKDVEILAEQLRQTKGAKE